MSRPTSTHRALTANWVQTLPPRPDTAGLSAASAGKLIAAWIREVFLEVDYATLNRTARETVRAFLEQTLGITKAAAVKHAYAYAARQRMRSTANVIVPQEVRQAAGRVSKSQFLGMLARSRGAAACALALMVVVSWKFLDERSLQAQLLQHQSELTNLEQAVKNGIVAQSGPGVLSSTSTSSFADQRHSADVAVMLVNREARLRARLGKQSGAVGGVISSTTMSSLLSMTGPGLDGEFLTLRNGRPVWVRLSGSVSEDLDPASRHAPHDPSGGSTRDYGGGGGGGTTSTNTGGSNITLPIDINGDTSGILPYSRGGIGFTSYTLGDLLVGTATGGLTRMPLGAQGYILTSSGGTVTWQPAPSVGSAGGWVDDGLNVRLQTVSDRVGIGTATPNTKLQVVGSGSFSGNLAVGKIFATAALDVAGTISGASLRITNLISGSGGIVARGTITFRSLTGCAALQSDSNGTLSCAAGLTLTSLDSRYVNIAGDTMTGALVIRPALGPTSIGLNVAATMSGRGLWVSGTGALPLISTNIGNRSVGIGFGNSFPFTPGTLTVSGSIVGYGGRTVVVKSSITSYGDQTQYAFGATNSTFTGTFGELGIGVDSSGNGVFQSFAGHAIVMNPAGNNVGILTTNPKTTLEVLGTVSGSSMYVSRTLSSSGGIVARGTITFRSLTGCAALQSDSNGTLSCGAGAFGTGNVLTLGDARYVRKAGDTMTGALVIQNGNSATKTSAALLNVRGTMSGRSLVVSGTGSNMLLHVDSTTNRVTIGGSTGSDLVNVMDGRLSVVRDGVASLSNQLTYGISVTNYNRAGTYGELALGVDTSGDAILQSFNGKPILFQGTGNNVGIGNNITAKTKLEVGGTISGALITQNGAGTNYMMGSLMLGRTTTNANQKLEVLGSISGSSLYVARTLSSSGGLVARGTITFRTLTGCSSIQSDSNGTLSCGTGGNGFGSGNVLTLGDARYVRKAGDTMTGALVIRPALGPTTIGLNVAATMSGRGLYVSGTGSQPLLATSLQYGTLMMGTGSMKDGTGSMTPQLFVAGRPSPTKTASVACPGGCFLNDLVVQNRYVYGVATNNTFYVHDVTNPTDPVIVGSVTVGISPSSVKVAGRYAYVISPANRSLQVIDVSNASSPVVVGSGSTIAAPRALAVQGKYAYIGGSSAFQIFDISDPTVPRAVSTLTMGSSYYRVVVQGDYAYLVDIGTDKMRIVNVSNAANPVLVSTTAVSADPLGIAVQGKYAYVVNNSSPRTFEIFDISNPAAPASVGSMVFTFGSFVNVVPQGRYVYTTTDGGSLRVYDVSNPRAPNLVSTITGPSYGLAIQGRYGYFGTVAGNLQIYDLGGAYIQQLEAGGIEAADVSVRNNLSALNADLRGTVTAQGGIVAQGPSSFISTSTGSFAVQVMSNTGGLRISARTAAQAHIVFGTGNIFDTRLWRSAVSTLQTNGNFYAQSLSGTQLFIRGAMSGSSLYIAKTLSASGGIVARGTISFRSLTGCSSIQSDSNGTLSCGSGGGSFGTGNVLTIGDSRYIRKSGGTMTGALNIRLTTGFVGLNVSQLISGSSLFIKNNASITGTLLAVGNITTRGTLSGSALTLQGGASSLLGTLVIGRTTLSANQKLEVVGAMSGSSLYVANTLSSSGGIVARGTITFRTLSGCSGLQTDSNGTLSCASGAGITQAAADARYVNTYGDTMTGVLVIQYKNTATATGTALLNVRGTMSGRGLYLSGTGASPLFATNLVNGRVGFGTTTPSAFVTIKPLAASSVGLSVIGVMSGRSLYVSGTGASPLIATNLVNGRVGIGTASPTELLDVNGDMRLQNYHTHNLTRTIPSAVNDEVDIGTYTFAQGAGSLEVEIVVNQSGVSTAKHYLIPVFYSATGGAWQTVLPIGSGVYNGGTDFDLEINSNATTTSLRIRRTLGSGAVTAYIVMSQSGLDTDTFAASTATSTVSAPTAYYTATQIIQIGSQVGVGKAVPKALFDVGGAISGASLHIAGNVGIGKVTPNAKLDVRGTISGAIIVGTYAGFGGNYAPAVAVDVTGEIRTTNFRTQSVTRTLPTTINDEVDIGTFSFTNGGGSVSLDLVIPSGSFSIAKHYIIPLSFAGTGGAWQIVAPVSSTGPYSGNDVDVDLNASGGSATLRIRRTLGSTAGTAYVSMQQTGLNTDGFTASSATSSVAAPVVFYNASVLTQVSSKVGINKTNPSTTLDVSGTISGNIVRAQSMLASSGVLIVKKSAGSSTGNILLVDSNGLVYDATNKRVGIGTNAPKTKLEVTGTISGAALTIQAGSSYNLGTEVIGRSTINANQKLEVLGSISGSSLFIANTISSSGGLVARGTIAFRSVTGCSSLQTDSNGTLSCASGGGITQTDGDARYIRKAGGTMTGMLTIQYGNTGVASGVLLRVRGAMSGRTLTLTSSGSRTPALTINKTGTGFAMLLSGSVIRQNAYGTPRVMSGTDFGTDVLAVAVQGQYAYLGTTSRTGNDFVIEDVTNPNAPHTVSGIDFSTDVLSIAVQGRYAYVGLTSAAGNDFRIVDIADPSNPTIVGGYDAGTSVTQIYLQGNFAFLGTTANPSLRTIDISNPRTPVLVGSCNAGGGSAGLMVRGTTAFTISSGNAAIKTHNITNLAALSCNTTNAATGVTGVDLAVVGNYTYGLSYDASNFTVALSVSTLAGVSQSSISYQGVTSNTAYSLKVSGRYAYITFDQDSVSYVKIIDISNPASVYEVGSLRTPTTARTIFITGKYAYIGMSSATGNDFRILDLAGADFPTANIGNLSVGDLSVDQNVRVMQNMMVGGGLQVGRGGILSQGSLSIISSSSGSSVKALDVRSASGSSLFTVTSSGSVGIGNATPKTKLEVSGTISGASLVISGTASITGALLVKGNIRTRGTFSGSTMTLQGGASSILGTMVIGRTTTNANVKLEVLGAMSGSSLVVSGNTSMSGTLSVGGTSTFKSRLTSLNSDIITYDTSNDTKMKFIANAGTYPSIQVTNGAETVGKALKIDVATLLINSSDGNGNVSIGRAMSTPGSMLSVSGAVIISKNGSLGSTAAKAGYALEVAGAISGSTLKISGTVSASGAVLISRPKNTQFLGLSDTTNNKTVGIYTGSGSPYNVVSGSTGSLFMDSYRGNVYVSKNGGGGSKGWKLLLTGTATGTTFSNRDTMWAADSTATVGGAITNFQNTNQYFNTYSNQAGGSNGDTMTNGFFLAGGTYTLSVLGLTNDAHGIIDWYIDGVLVASGQDWYGVGTAFNVIKTATVTVTGDGYHVLKGVINGKNASATGYYKGLTKMWLSPANDYSHTSPGADYAEWFRTSEAPAPVPGTLVCVDVLAPNSVKTCVNEADPNVMGIVSTNPSFIGNDNTFNGVPIPGTVLVGLIGQIPARVIVESGAGIKPGDSLTPANKPGFARRANPGEPTVGVALEARDSGEGTINVLVARSNKSVTVEMLNEKVRDNIASLQIGDQIAQKLQDGLQKLNLNEEVRNEVQAVMNDPNATITPLFTRVQMLEQNLATLRAELAAFASGSTLAANNPAPLGGSLTLTGSLNASDFTSENNLTVGRDARIGGDLYLEGALKVGSLVIPGGANIQGTVTTGILTAASGSQIQGTLQVSGDLLVHSTIRFSTGAAIQASQLIVSGALLVQGPITIQGLATFLGDVSINGELKVATRQAGYASIGTGETMVVVRFDPPFTSTPIVNASPDMPVLFAVSKATQTGFTIRLRNPELTRVTFSFLALTTDAPRTASGMLTPLANQITFPLDAQGVPVSSSAVWNACIRNQQPMDPVTNMPFSCTRYRTDTYTWTHPDFPGLSFIWNDSMTPPLLILPQGYVSQMIVVPSSSSSSSSIDTGTGSSSSSEVSSGASSSLSTSSSSSSSFSSDSYSSADGWLPVSSSSSSDSSSSNSSSSSSYASSSDSSSSSSQ